MSICQMQWRSDVLAKTVHTNIIVPDIGEPPFPVFYLLHGRSDDHTAWLERTRLSSYVKQLPLVIVMPDGDRGFYTNNENGPDYATYIAEELPTLIERHFAVETSAEKRCIGGLSMGGYGAFRIGLGYAGRYASITSHSGALTALRDDLFECPEIRRIFGTSPEGTEHDLVELAKRAKATGKLPKLRIDCGHDDFLIEENRKYHSELEALGIAHEYEEFPGAHTWDYWDIHIREALDFHCKVLGIEPLTAGNG